MTEEQAIQIHMLIYTACYDIGNKTAKVDKVLKQIRKGLRGLPDSLYKQLVHDVHNAWERARRKLIDKDSVLDVKMSEFIANLYNTMDGNKFQNIYYTDKSMTAMINSFESCYANRSDDIKYTVNARELTDEFLNEIGVVRNRPLFTKKNIIKQNIIIEKGV